MKRALVVQPNENSIKLLNDALGDAFSIDSVADFSNAYDLAGNSAFDLMIFCVNDSSFDDAMKLVTELRSFDHYSNSPFIVLSDAKNSFQLSRAFENGCDEYLAQPIEASELKVRVRARVKDLVPTQKTKYFWAADLRFCAGTLRVVATDDLGTEDLDLTPNEFRILFLLSRHPNKTLTRDFILIEVWGQNMHVVARTVDKHVCSLRRKLGRRSSYLVSVPNKGYMFHTQAVVKKDPVASAILTSAS